MNLFERLKGQKLLSISLLVFTLSIGILIGTLVNTAVRAEKGQSAAAPDASPLVIPNPTQLSTAFSQLAKQLEPSVVNITSTYGQPEQQRSQRATPPRRRQQQPQAQPEDEDQQDQGGMDFFRRFFGGAPEMPQPFRRRQGTGSGVVVDKNGYILTNYHVVEDATRIQVKFNNDSREYTAKLIGSDPETDLAVIRVDAGHTLQAAKVGNSDSAQVGDWCVAIGSPFGLEATVTAGIISAKGRDLPGSEHQLQSFLQTDAAINPGNSGGPLLDIKGEVIGINTAIATESGGYQGIGFALPINMAAKVYNQIIKEGKVSRGAIGISFVKDIKPEILKTYGAKDGGVFVQEVTPNGPADKAGIKAEDVIVSLNGKPVKNGDELVSRVSDMAPGTQAAVGVLRDNKRQDVKVTIGGRTEVFAGDPRFRQFRRDEPEGQEAAQQAKFGISIKPLTDAERDRLGYEEKGGVLVTNVEQGSFAEDAGIAARDIITAINRQPVNSVDDVVRIQKTLKQGDPVVFKVMRGVPNTNGRMRWQPLFIAGTLSENQ